MYMVLGSMTCNAQRWSTGLKEALKTAAAQDKYVLLYFTGGSDCGNCTKLEQNVLRSEAFLAYAQTHFVLVRQDFKSDDLEESLLIVEKYNKDGFFPWVVIIGPNAKSLGQLGVYQDETPQQYVAKLREITK